MHVPTSNYTPTYGSGWNEPVRGWKAILLSVIISIFVMAVFFLLWVLKTNVPWKKSEEINTLLETAITSKDDVSINGSTKIEEPYVLIFLSGDRKSAEIDDAELWKKPFVSLSDNNIKKINTFIFVLNEYADSGDYNDGSSLITYHAVIKYLDNTGKCLGCEFIDAEPLPEEKQSSGSAGVQEQYVAKYKVMQYVKKHID